MKVMKSLRVMFAAAALVVTAASAQAATFPACTTLPPDASGKLTSNIGCVGIGGIGSSNPGAGDLNDMFGQASWSLIQKFDVIDGKSIDGSEGGFSFSSADKNFSGRWSISQTLLDSWKFLAIVMKDGNQDPIPTLAYLVNTVGGAWNTPWAKQKCTGTGDKKTCVWEPLNSLSNVQLWVSEKNITPPPPPVPLPAAGFLLVGALGGLAALRRRRKV